ncbi:hypothetical protein F8M41_008652 [Gigaspora margarita]|uniref:Uncharacterized protein n=1 Tax=Gigaspora margarita TaxID=4874 RepID=A0A8H4AVJ6_GIGMA|nr:hypothetical protein F8M41_008652 [Gigaspora margarita]
MHLLDPITDNYLHGSDIVKTFIHDSKEYDNFKKTCLENQVLKKRLECIYGHDKENKLIAVSKRGCYLCELYIKFVQSKGHNITVSVLHKKLYHGWKLPDTFKKQFMSDTIFVLDNIIEREIGHHADIIAKSDSEAESVDSDEESYYNMMSQLDSYKFKR